MEALPEIVIDAERPRHGLELRQLWAYRDLLWLLIRRDVSVRYRETFLGVLWALLLPAGMMVIFSIIFGRLARIPSDGVPYALFAFSGLLPWQFFASSLSGAGRSVLGSGPLISKVYFPRLIIPVATLGVPLVDFAVASVFMAGLMVFLGHWPSWQVGLVPLLMLVVAMLAVGLGALIAALTASFRDFGHLLAPMITLWMFLTPIIYPASLVPESWRWLLTLNPMTGLVAAMRSAWLGLPWDLPALGASVAVAVLALVVGVHYFRSVERRFADMV